MNVSPSARERVHPAAPLRCNEVRAFAAASFRLPRSSGGPSTSTHVQLPGWRYRAQLRNPSQSSEARPYASRAFRVHPQTNSAGDPRAVHINTPRRMEMATQDKDAIALLKEDHKKVRGLLTKLEATTERAQETREELLAKIAMEIRMHSTIEEEIFYPAYKAAATKKDDVKLYQEALEEHHLLDTVLSEMGACDPQSEVFSAKAKVLKELVEHHAAEEEKEMFPRARRFMKASELQQLGSTMKERKRALEDANEGWLPAAGKLLAAVASQVTPGATKSRPRASAAARGAARKTTRAATTTAKKTRAKVGKTAAPRGRAKSAKGRKK
ncbi:MAG: hemerythrin domain-containing protein [Candidatus Binatia bacterium]